MAQKKANVPATRDKEETGVAEFTYDSEHEGGGFDHQTRDDVAIPFLAVLQALSPQIETLAAAKPGQLFNTVTEELLDEVLFVPSTTQHVFVEWVPRASGGGFVGVHQLDAPEVKVAKEAATEFGKYKLPNGNELQETFYIYGVLCTETDSLGPAVIAFTSTKIKVYKRYNTRLQTFMLMGKDGRKVRPPLYAHLTRITTAKEKNNKGEFFNFVLAPAGESLMTSLLSQKDPRFEAAFEIKRLVDSGAGRAAYESVDGSEPEGDGPLPF